VQISTLFTGTDLRAGMVTNIPANMVVDQFGMIGLLTFIRAAETDPNLGRGQHFLGSSLFRASPIFGFASPKLFFRRERGLKMAAFELCGESGPA